MGGRVWLKSGKPDGTDYSKDRSVAALMEFSRAKIGRDERTLRK